MKLLVYYIVRYRTVTVSTFLYFRSNPFLQYGLRQALQLLIYTLVTVCVIIFVAGSCSAQ